MGFRLIVLQNRFNPVKLMRRVLHINSALATFWDFASPLIFLNFRSRKYQVSIAIFFLRSEETRPVCAYACSAIEPF